MDAALVTNYQQLHMLHVISDTVQFRD